MSTLTTYMNLTAWTDTTDPYSHTQLANNLSVIDGHDHSPGKGKQIPTAGVADRAITQPKLAEPCVGTNQLIDNSVTIDKLDGSILGAFVPMGIVFPFWRPAGTSTVVWGDRASGHLFELCDGRTIAQSEHDLGVASSIVLPNLIDKFALFGAAANIGVTGGSGTVNLSHSHTVNGHSHTVNSHSHNVNAHSHTIGDHRHGLDADGSHTHTIDPDGGHAHAFAGGHIVHSRENAFLGGIEVTDIDSNIRANALESLYLAGFFDTQFDHIDAAAPMDAVSPHSHGGGTGLGGTHSHGGQTGLVNTGNLGTSSATPGTSSASPSTDSQSPGTNSALGSTENRPPFMTLVPLIRVRNP